MRQLRALRAAKEKPPGPWLFRPDPLHREPAPEEEAALRLLEQQAAELEAMTRGPRTAEQQAREAVKRRFLGIELDAHGLLQQTMWPDKLRWLKRWELPLLVSYLEAAQALHAYYDSEARKAAFGVEPHPTAWGLRVSVDWFRHPGPVPSAFDAQGWLLFCEGTLLAAPGTHGQEGEILTRVGGPWFVVSWRKDDGEHPAVLRARVRGG